MSQPADPVTIARDLLRCRSVTPAEGGALGLIENLLGGAGFAVQRLTFAEPGTIPVENLYARVGSSPPHLVFAGHTDVVPPGDETRWSYPPFAGEVAAGTLYGRGAVDMKGGIACALAAALLGSPRRQWSKRSPRSAAHCKSLVVPLTAMPSSSPVMRKESEPEGLPPWAAT